MDKWMHALIMLLLISHEGHSGRWPLKPDTLVTAPVLENQGARCPRCCVSYRWSHRTHSLRVWQTGPEVIRQQKCCGGTDSTWVERGGKNDGFVWSWQHLEPIKSAYLIFFKSAAFPVMAPWQMHDREDNPAPSWSKRKSWFYQELSLPVQGHCVW